MLRWASTKRNCREKSPIPRARRSYRLSRSSTRSSPLSWPWRFTSRRFLLTAASWLGWMQPLRRSAYLLIWLAFVIHTFAILARIYISGRPPVTNLYSSAVFIGWGAALFGIVIEMLFRLGAGNVISAVLGFSTLIIAHQLAYGADTFTVLQAVLDTQFWLATHVVCITFGYLTTFVAGLAGIIYIMAGLLGTAMRGDTGKQLVRIVYGTTCFAIFFSFIGTVLGGLWADDSWGRFWGWDSQRERRSDDCPLERPDLACPVGRHGARPRIMRSRHPGQHRDRLVLVRRERIGGRVTIPTDSPTVSCWRSESSVLASCSLPRWDFCRCVYG